MFTKRTILTGSESVEGIDINVSLEYEGTNPPTKVFINFVDGDVYAYGEVTTEGFENFNSNGGLVDCEILKIIESRCIKYLADYESL